MRDRASNSGLTLSNKSTLLANDKPLDKLIVGQLDAEGVSISLASAATHLRIDSYAGQEKMCDTPMDTHWQRQEEGQESQPTWHDELEDAQDYDDWHSTS